MKHLETERLSLRPVQEADKPFLYTLLGHPEVMRYWLGGRAMTPEEVDELTAHYSGDYESLLVTEKATKKAVGLAGIVPCDYLGVADYEFGWGLLPEAWGKGYATEMTHALTEVGFRELPLKRLLALAHPANTASWRVLEKAGMSFVTEIETADRGPRRVYSLRPVEPA